MTAPRSDDLQRRIDAMAARIGVKDKIETKRQLSEEARAFLMRARASAVAETARKRRDAELLARCIVDEFERRAFRADWLS